MTEKPDYQYQFKIGDDTEWDYFPRDMRATAENDEWIKIILLDKSPIRIVHAEKDAVRESDFETVGEFRELINWDIDWD